MTGQFTGRHMSIVIVGFFVVIFLMNLVLAYFAIGSWPGLLVRNGYDASQTYNQQLEQARLQNQLGWQSQIEIGDDTAVLHITDKAGDAIPGLKITAAAARPTNESEDTMLTLTENANGSYVGDAHLSSGRWIISIRAQDNSGSQTYRYQFRVFVPQRDQ